MKCFLFFRGEIHEGLPVHPDKGLGLVLLLGEAGHGNSLEKIPLLKKDPPRIEGGRVCHARPVVCTYRGANSGLSFIALAKPNRPKDRRILIRVNADWVFPPGSVGVCGGERGLPKKIIAGYGSRHSADCLSRWYDELIIMSPGDVLWIGASGYMDGMLALVYSAEDGSVSCLPYKEYMIQNVAAPDDMDIRDL